MNPNSRGIHILFGWLKEIFKEHHIKAVNLATVVVREADIVNHKKLTHQYDFSATALHFSLQPTPNYRSCER